MARLAEGRDDLRLYLRQISDFQPLEREEELAIAKRWTERGDVDAAHQLVQAHLRFVVKIANHYRGYGFQLADLVEEGNVGLMEAVRRFDPERNLRFMTYAAYWIRAYILAHILKQWSLVGVGTGPLQSKLFFRLARERSLLQASMGDTVSETEMEQLLARRFATTPERIRDMTGRLGGKDSSLNDAAFRDSEVSAIDLVMDESSEDIEEHTGRTEVDEQVRSRLSSVMPRLSDRERYILERRLLGDDDITLAEIGRRLRLSRERVRQLEERLKGKLRKALSEFEPAAA